MGFEQVDGTFAIVLWDSSGDSVKRGGSLWVETTGSTKVHVREVWKREESRDSEVGLIGHRYSV